MIKEHIWPIARPFLLAIVVFTGAVILLEKSFIFYPYRELEGTPKEWGLQYEDIFFSTVDGVRLHGWFIPAEKGAVTLLWFHGNAGNISHRLDNIRLFHDRLGINIFIFDYREYGKSEGKVSEEGTYRDADAALRHLRSRTDIDPSRIVFFGRSLGAAVAVDLAARESCFGLIVESPFLSVKEMAKSVFPFLPLGSLLKTQYDSLAKIKKATAPLLVLHADRDEVVPFEQGKHLFEAANEPKEFFTIQGARHNDTYIVGGESYLRAFERFLKKLG